MTQTFLQNFGAYIQQAHADFFPNQLHATDVELDPAYGWINIRFGVAHKRQVDELYIRLFHADLGIDFSLGAQLPTCIVDSAGTRWIEFDTQDPYVKQVKQEVEKVSQGFYQIVQKHKKELRFVLEAEKAIASMEEVER